MVMDIGGAAAALELDAFACTARRLSFHTSPSHMISLNGRMTTGTFLRTGLNAPLETRPR